MLSDDDDFRQSIRRFARSDVAEGRMPEFRPEQWVSLADLGALALGTSTGGGTATDIAGCMEELGAAGFVGPLIETIIAVHALGEHESLDIMSGKEIASVTWDPTIVPWGNVAEVVILFEDNFAAHHCVADRVHELHTLGGDPWASATLRIVASLGEKQRAVEFGDIAIAGYLVGAGLRVLELAAAYARDRSQFGQRIGDYQAVSHPLAETYARLHAARDLLGVAASADMPVAPSVGQQSARARLLAAEAAVCAAEVAMQVHGGMGFVADTLLAHLSKRIRHVSLLGQPQWLIERRALPNLETLAD